MRSLRILGTRGIPAAHGGFETFAEQLALYLVRRGWRVIVYCQVDGDGDSSESPWRGIERVVIPIAQTGAKGTMLFDWKCVRHAARCSDLCLTLGYNTAFLCAWLRLRGIPNLINMDGLEWRRAKWGGLAKVWFWLNERAACWLADHLVADHPDIARHLKTRVRGDKITTIAYGAHRVAAGDVQAIATYGLSPGGYITVVARAEPENSLLEIVQGFSRCRRGLRLVILGNYYSHHAYHAAVKAAASDEVLFIGAVYDTQVVRALRYHSLAYMHGHRVGGTNPSLVEAMGAGNPVIAHDNTFNRWVAGEGARYFATVDDVSAILDQVLGDRRLLSDMQRASARRFEAGLTWEQILVQYEQLLEAWHPAPGAKAKVTEVADSVAGVLEPAALDSPFTVDSLSLKREEH